ncbi:MAG: flotillin-like FloA family protein [Acidobacteriota bacterium]
MNPLFFLALTFWAVFLLLLGYFIPVRLWVQAASSGVPVRTTDLIGMRLRRTPPEAIVLPAIRAAKAGCELPLANLEAHHLAGGNVDRVVSEMLAAHQRGETLSLEDASRRELASQGSLDELRRAWSNASEADRGAFLDELKEAGRRVS